MRSAFIFATLVSFLISSFLIAIILKQAAIVKFVAAVELILVLFAAIWAYLYNIKIIAACVRLVTVICIYTFLVFVLSSLFIFQVSSIFSGSPGETTHVAECHGEKVQLIDERPVGGSAVYFCLGRIVR